MAAGMIIVPPYTPVRDRDDNLCPGALLDVFENNTTTRVTVYTDFALTIPGTNPIVANSSGMFPTRYLEAGTDTVPELYTVSVTKADGSSPGNPFVFNDYQPSIAMALQSATPVSLFNWIPVELQPAIIDGTSTTDVSSYIQDAIDFVADIGGGNVVAPYGIYRLSSGLDVPANVAFLMDAGATLKPLSDFNIIRQHARSTVKAKVDTTATTFTSSVLLLDGNDEASADTAFRLHVPTVFDLDIDASIVSSTGTAVKLKCTTTNARIMGVQGNLKLIGLAKGFDLELAAIDGSNFVTASSFTFEGSETLQMIDMDPGVGGTYHLDRLSFYGSCQPRAGTTSAMYNLAGQYNNFNILAWDWDTVAGTAPYAFIIQAGARESLLQTVVASAYINTVSTEKSFVVWNYLSGVGFSTVQTGLVRGPTGSGNLIDDVPNGTGLRVFRINGANAVIINASRHLEFYGNSGSPAVFRNINLTATRNYDLLNVAGSIPIVTAVPATATSTGVAGQIAFDASYAYFCTAANTWVRAAVATW